LQDPYGAHHQEQDPQHHEKPFHHSLLWNYTINAIQYIPKAAGVRAGPGAEKVRGIAGIAARRDCGVII
jgi:hypothetical protein